MAVDIYFHDQIFTIRCAGREDRSRCLLIPKQHRYRPSYSAPTHDQVDRLVITVTSSDEDTDTASDYNCDGGSTGDERTDTAMGDMKRIEIPLL